MGGLGVLGIILLNDFRPDPAVGGMITYGKFSLLLGNTGGQRRTLGYRYSESILPVDRRALVVGLISDSSGSLILQKPTQAQQQFIISLQDDETLAKSADNNAKLAFYSMLVCVGLGLLFVVLGLWG
jgi:hypothetical protein